MTSVDPRALPAAAASVATDVRAQKPQHLRRNPFGDVLIYLILLASASLVLGPFALSFMTAFKSPQQFASESSLALPNPWTTENFARLFGGDYGFVSPIVVTAQVVAVILVGQLLFSVMAAYAFAKLQFRGRDSLFWVYLATLMVPQVVIVIPLFVMMSQLGLRNTFWSLVLPFMFGSPYAIFLLREYFRSIPADLIRAARIDGASTLDVIVHVVLPASRSILVTLGLITVVSQWNSFMWPLVITSGASWRVLTVATAGLQSQFDAQWTVVLAATTVAIVPLILLFSVLGRHIVRSIVVTGLK